MRLYRIFTASRYENGALKQGKRGQRREETKNLDKQDCLGLAEMCLEAGPIKVKDMILKESLEEKREATAKAVKAFSGQGEAPAEV